MNRNETNISTGGGAIIGSAVGAGSSVSGNTISITESFNLTEKSGRNDLLSALKQFQVELDKTKDIPPDSLDDIKANLDATIKAVDRPEPNKPRAIEKLEGIQKILDSLKGSAVSAIALGKLVGEIMFAASSVF